MTYELVCSKCGYTIYSGFDLRSPGDLLKPSGYRCGRCKANLDPRKLSVEVTRPDSFA